MNIIYNHCRCGKEGTLKFDKHDNICGLMCNDCWYTFQIHQLIKEKKVKSHVLKDVNLTKKLKDLKLIFKEIKKHSNKLTSGNVSHLKMLVSNEINRGQNILKELINGDEK